MVVGHAQVVETGLPEPGSILGGHAKGIAARAPALGAGATIAEHTFEVAHGQVGPLQNEFSVFEEIGTIVGREHHGRMGRAHHDVANHSAR